MSDYATLEDLKKHWPDLPDSKEAEAEQKIKEAQIEIKGLYRNIDSRVQSGDLDPDAVRLVICRMVKRALLPVTEGMERVDSVTQAQSGFSQTLSFAGSADGALYLTKADKRLLAADRSEQAFTIYPGGRP